MLRMCGIDDDDIDDQELDPIANKDELGFVFMSRDIEGVLYVFNVCYAR